MKYRVIWLDESSLTFRCLHQQAYSPKSVQLMIDEQDLRARTVHVMAGISIEAGVEGFVMKYSSFKALDF